jgi:lipid II:glycine glycyltransferase (peptidoglycan interpeptide bridge formation enzyme)
MKFESTQEIWDQKVIGLNGSILQSWIWGVFSESLGHKVHRFYSDSYVNQVVEEALPFGKKYFYSARGPLGNADAAIKELKSYSSDSGLVFARIEPEKTVELPKAVKNIQPTNNWVLSLEPDEDAILQKMKPKHRYNIGLAQKRGVVVRQGDKKDILALWRLLLETAQRNNFRLHPQNYYWNLFEVLSPKNLKLMIAEYKGQVLAASAFTLFFDTALYLHGGSSSQYKEVMFPHLLHWESIRLAKKEGFKFYDFGGVAPNDDQNHPWAGISRFKKGFGGFEVVYPGAYDLIFSPLWYNVYRNGRKFRRILSFKSN